MRETSKTRLDNRKNQISSRTIQKAFRSLHAFLSWCQQRGYIDINPASSVKAPQVSKYVPNVMNIEQCHEFLYKAKETSPEKYYIFYLLALGTGSRLSETMGFKWADIDFEKGSASIQKTFDRKSLDTGTKNRSSIRKVEIPQFILKELKPFYLAAFNKQSFIFENVKYHELTKQDFKPLLRSLKFSEKIRIHDLRHSHASLLIAAGVDPKQIQNQLGHAKIGTTFDTYGHLFSTRVVADKLDDLHKNSQKTP